MPPYLSTFTLVSDYVGGGVKLSRDISELKIKLKTSFATQFSVPEAAVIKPKNFESGSLSKKYAHRLRVA